MHPIKDKMYLQKMKCSVSEKAQWIKAPDAKPDDLNSVFRIHMMKGKN